MKSHISVKAYENIFWHDVFYMGLGVHTNPMIANYTLYMIGCAFIAIYIYLPLLITVIQCGCLHVMRRIICNSKCALYRSVIKKKIARNYFAHRNAIII